MVDATKEGHGYLSKGECLGVSYVVQGMSHSLNTEATYYQAIVGDSHAARAYSTMKRLQQETPSKQGDSSDTSRGICTPQRRCPFSQEETDQVKKYFKENIARGVTVSLVECKSFISNTKLSRTPKNIQDKVRNLLKAGNK